MCGFFVLVELLMIKSGAFLFGLIFTLLALLLAQQELNSAQAATQFEAAPLITIGAHGGFSNSFSLETRERQLDSCDTYLKTDRLMLLPEQVRTGFATACSELAKSVLRGTPFSGHAWLVVAGVAHAEGDQSQAVQALTNSRTFSPDHGRTAQRRLLLSLHMDRKGVSQALIGAEHDVKVMLSGFGLRWSLANLYQQLPEHQQTWLIRAIESGTVAEQRAFIGQLRQQQERLVAG